MIAQNRENKQETVEYDGSTPLSIMRELVLSKILSGMYQADAYLEVYKCKDIRVAEAAASRLLSNVRVKKRLEYKKKELLKKFEVNEGKITRERVKIGFANIQDFMDEKGQIKPTNQITRDKLATVAEIELDETLGTVKKFKFHSKHTALDALSKQLGLYEKDNLQKQSDTQRQAFSVAEQRLFDEWMDYRLKQSLAVPEALEPVNEVIIDE
jgi:hypothetical protein